MSKRKPVLPAIRDRLSVPLLHHEYLPGEAAAELRAAEAVIRAAEALDRENTGARMEAVRRSVARWRRVTGRKAR